MNEPQEPDIWSAAVAELPGMVKVLAAFTAQLELHSYTRAEAIRLTGDYLRAIVTGKAE